MINKAVGYFLKFYNRSSIRYTVFISFTSSALLAILMTGVTFYLRFSAQIKATLHSENQNLVEQINRSLSTYLSDMIRLSNSVSYHVIKNNIKSSSISEQLQLLYDANSNYIKNITLFSADGRMLATAPPAMLKNGVSVTAEPWFIMALQRTENLHFQSPMVQNLFMDAEGQYSWVMSLSCAVEITENKAAKTGVLLIDLRYSGVSELFANMSLVGGGYIYLIDSDGKLIYHPRQQLIASGLYAEINEELAGYRDGSYVVKGPNETDVVIVRSAGYTGWSIIGVIPQRGMTLDGFQNILFLLVIFFMYFAIIILVNSTLSRKLTDPVKLLEISVQSVEQGLAGAEIYVGGSEEIQQLGKSIQHMVDIMRKLTDDIVEEQTQKQKSELNALQAQINPHFLYNTLDIIVWMIEKGQPEDALKIVSALARFFRLSLNKGKNITTLRDELDHARSYLMIQSMRYKNKFTYSISADEEALNMSSLKLVLQPIVENAIYHAMDYMVDDDGRIRITAKVENGDLLLMVEDNGPGMPEGMIANLLTLSAVSSKGSGIGLKNVHERIALYFGAKYGLTIESELDAGTRVLIRMPAVAYDEKAR
ncbi:MAG: sensor histidine kinase [Clostridiales bacterium]|jgi:two-component system sensor histidine kinase YesM|nr:sensor histidine kinase [Clostridiales bacterium]